MKIRMYIDVYPGHDLRYISATTMPGAKYEGVTRIAFNVEIPESILREVDAEAAGTSQIEVLE